MNTIKSFIYLDEYKMYSISSQIFEGFTETIINETAVSKKEEEQQKGPVASGRLMADIVSKELHTIEKKFLFDYAYTCFEKELLTTDRVLVINSTIDCPEENAKIQPGFVKVSGIAKINDLLAISKFSKEYNQFGEALAYVTSFSKKAEIEEKIRADLALNKAQNKNASKKALTSAFNPKNIAKEMGLYMDEKYLECLNITLEMGLKDNFEIEVLPFGEDGIKRYIALLNRDHLRDTETNLVKKFSRTTQMPITIFGLITRIGSSGIESLSSTQNDLDIEVQPNLRKALRIVFQALANVEESFISISENEIMIDPIAVYREI